VRAVRVLGALQGGIGVFDENAPVISASARPITLSGTRQNRPRLVTRIRILSPPTSHVDYASGSPTVAVDSIQVMSVEGGS